MRDGFALFASELPGGSPSTPASAPPGRGPAGTPAWRVTFSRGEHRLVTHDGLCLAAARPEAGGWQVVMFFREPPGRTEHYAQVAVARERLAELAPTLLAEHEQLERLIHDLRHGANESTPGGLEQIESLRIRQQVSIDPRALLRLLGRAASGDPELVQLLRTCGPEAAALADVIAERGARQ